MRRSGVWDHRNRGLVSLAVRHDKDPFLFKGRTNVSSQQFLHPFTCKVNEVKSPYEWKLLRRLIKKNHKPFVLSKRIACSKIERMQYSKVYSYYHVMLNDVIQLVLIPTKTWIMDAWMTKWGSAIIIWTNLLYSKWLTVRIDFMQWKLII